MKKPRPSPAGLFGFELDRKSARTPSRHPTRGAGSRRDDPIAAAHSANIAMRWPGVKRQSGAAGIAPAAPSTRQTTIGLLTNRANSDVPQTGDPYMGDPSTGGGN